MEKYYNKKLLQAICFADDVKIYLDENVLTPAFLEMAKHFLEDCNLGGFVSETMRNNLIELADYLRYHGQPDLANDFIRLTNVAEVSYFCWHEFLYKEFEKRRTSPREKYDIFDAGSMKVLFTSLEMDYLVLQSLLCDDETFQNDFVPGLILDEFYFISCKRIGEEVPQLFEDEKTRERIITIHLCNKMMKKEMGADQKDDYKSVIKTGKKLVKKVIK
mgnify:CR=1 FL=1